MSSVWGHRITVSVFGESHGAAIGVVIDSLPAGKRIDLDKVLIQMARRAPGLSKSSTTRLEKDIPRVISGLLDGVTTGAPVCAVIENTNAHSKDYGNLGAVMRPSHSDYPAFVKYGGYNDIRGGGHFSGRLTAPLVFAGAVCRQFLEDEGIMIGGHVARVGKISDEIFDMNHISRGMLEQLSETTFATISPGAALAMQAEIEKARLEQDSVGGIVECAAIGLPVGIGSNIFSTVESRLSSLLFAIPAVKGVEFGLGFGFSTENASAVNDAYEMDGDAVSLKTNYNGGILGGMTDGAPLVVRAAFKPTPSISKAQDSVNLLKKKNEILTINGRHDPCIVGRALPVVESAVAIGLLDLILEAK